MTSYHWLKLWIDILDDWKIAPLSDRLWRRFIECCLIAKKLDEGGYLDSVERMAFFLRLAPDEMEQDLIALEQATRSKDKPGVVQKVDGRWFVTNLDKRQSRMTATQRKRKQRERDREVSRDGHDSVTKSDHRGQRTEDQRIRGSDEQTTTDNRGAGAPAAAAAVLAQVHELGITDPKATSLVDAYLERGELPELLPRLQSWIECYEDRAGIDNVLGLAIRQAENGLDPPQDGDSDYWARFARQQKAAREV